MKTFSIKGALNRGWEIFKGNKKLLILATLVFLLITGIENSDMWFPEIPVLIRIIIGLVLFILVTIVQIGWYKFLLKVYDGEAARIKELFTHKELFFKYLGTLILFMLIIGIPVLIGGAAAAGVLSLSSGYVLLAIIMAAAVLASLYLAIKYGFSLVLAVDTDLKIRETFKTSARMTDGIKLKLAGFFIIMALLNILGIIALLVGLLVSIPVTMLAYMYVYRTLSWTGVK